MSSMIATDAQRTALGTMIELFTIDASNIGGPVYRFVTGPFGGDVVRYQDLVYTPIPIATEGFKYGGDGPIARPTLTIAKINRDLVNELVGLNNWKGADFTRLVTFSRYLDNQSDADPNRHFPLDYYRVETMTGRNKTEIKWELRDPTAEENYKPGRLMFREVCNFRYREWNGSEFVYFEEGCPYVGDDYFDIDGNPVSDPALDVASHEPLTCGFKRFARNNLPCGFFLGLGLS